MWGPSSISSLLHEPLPLGLVLHYWNMFIVEYSNPSQGIYKDQTG